MKQRIVAAMIAASLTGCFSQEQRADLEIALSEPSFCEDHAAEAHQGNKTQQKECAAYCLYERTSRLIAPYNHN